MRSHSNRQVSSLRRSKSAAAHSGSEGCRATRAITPTTANSAVTVSQKAITYWNQEAVGTENMVRLGSSSEDQYVASRLAEAT